MSEILDSALRRAIDAIGGTKALAAELGIRAPSIYSWRRTPAERVLAVERATGVSRYELRPDIYPPPASMSPPAPKRRAVRAAE